MFAVATGWADCKDALVAAFALPRDALHIGFGLLLFLITTGVSRRGTGDLRALALVLAVEGGNEMLDLAHQAGGALDLAESWRDLLDTVCLPTTIVLWTHALAAWTPRRRRSQRRSAAALRRPTARGYQPATAAFIASRST